VDGTELIAEGLREQFFRAPTDIDFGSGGPEQYGILWLKAGLDRLVRSVESIEAGLLAPDVWCLRTRTSLATQRNEFVFKIETRYWVDGTGKFTMQADIEVPPGLPTYPRLGWTLELPTAFDHLSWYGRGPQENYSDRKLGATVGLYSSRVKDQHIPYIFPQENGGKTDVRWLALRNAAGLGLKIQGTPTLHFSAIPYSVEQLAQTDYEHELPPSDRIFLNLDAKHMGLGGDTGWNPNVHPEFWIPPGRTSFEMSWQPLRPGEMSD
jgi:beta-galactosidase